MRLDLRPEAKTLRAKAKVKYGAGGRSDARLTHIVIEVEVKWYKGRAVGLDATWLCGGYSKLVRLFPEPTEALPLCPTCEWKDAHGGPFVYIAERDDRIKIGFSVAPGQRSHQLQANLLCYFPGTLADERAMHARFDADRIAGEWFRPSAALRAFIAEMQERAA